MAKLLKIKPEAGQENVKGKQIKSDFVKKWDGFAKIPRQTFLSFLRSHDSQHYHIQNDGTKHKGFICDAQHIDIKK